MPRDGVEPTRTAQLDAAAEALGIHEAPVTPADDRNLIGSTATCEMRIFSAGRRNALPNGGGLTMRNISGCWLW